MQLVRAAGPRRATPSTRRVKIGVLTDMSGVAVDEMGPGSVLAAQIAAEDMGGTVAGMKIEIVAGDHQQKPDVGASVARRWFDQESVDAVADVPNSSVGLAINKLARAANKVFMPSSSQQSNSPARSVRPTRCAGRSTPGHLAQLAAALMKTAARPGSSRIPTTPMAAT